MRFSRAPREFQELTSRLRIVALPLALMAFIAVLSSIPGTGGSTTTLMLGFVPPALQNLLHIPLFASLAWSWRRALARLGWSPGTALATAVLISLGWAVLDELHQLYVPGRYASLTDMTLNTLGVTIGIIIYAKFTTRDAS